jgi:ankyrin repeat protein
MLAAREGYAQTVAALLRYKPNLSYRNLAGDTALMLAALAGNAEVVDVLIKGGAALDHEGWTPLMYAAFEGHLDIVERLLAAGADVNALAPNRANALMLAARNGHIEVVRRLLKTDVDLNQQTDRGLNADAWAESNGNTDIAELIRAARAKLPPQSKAIRIEIK